MMKVFFRKQLAASSPELFSHKSSVIDIWQLPAYGFDQPSLYLIFSYLWGRTQRTKLNYAYSSYTDIKYGVPQGSILVPLLFNIDVCDLFFRDYKCDIASYADDNIPYTSEKSLNFV